MSLSEEIDVECLSLEKITTYLKRWKVHKHWGKSFFCPMDKKMISPHGVLEQDLVCAHFLQNKYKFPKVYAL